MFLDSGDDSDADWYMSRQYNVDTLLAGLRAVRVTIQHFHGCLQAKHTGV